MSNSIDYSPYQSEEIFGQNVAYVAVDNFIVLCILDDLEDFPDSSINLRAGTTNEDGILGCRVAGFGTHFDRKGLVFTDNSDSQ